MLERRSRSARCWKQDRTARAAGRSKIPASRPPTIEFADGGGRIGFINPVTQPFCERLQPPAVDGRRPGPQLPVFDRRVGRPRVLRSGGTDDELAELVRASVGAKRPGHGINSDAFVKPERAMYQIGG